MTTETLTADAYPREVLTGSMPYTDRATKATWFAERYQRYLGRRVLDVGCDDAKLRPLLPDADAYTGIDLTEAADVRCDLDGGVLPFADASFDSVVCLDVLEHLEQIHAVFDELCRVTSRWVLISLPNPARCFLDEVITGREGRLKHYGLPVEPRKDRHRWFFGADEAEAFVVHRAARADMRIERIDFEPATPVSWDDGRGNDVLAGERLRLGPMWAVLERVPSTGPRGA